MRFKKNNFFLLIILILLQSCSGGRIGNFLESSFKNIEESKIKEDIKNIEESKIKEDIKNIEESKIKEDIRTNLNNKKASKSEKISINNKKVTEKKISRQKRQYRPQSYKIIFILKDVDPKDPIEDLSTILRNSDVNFEIEKIERFFDSKNKGIKNN